MIPSFQITSNIPHLQIVRHPQSTGIEIKLGIH